MKNCATATCTVPKVTTIEIAFQIHPSRFTTETQRHGEIFVFHDARRGQFNDLSPLLVLRSIFMDTFTISLCLCVSVVRRIVDYPPRLPVRMWIIGS